MVVVGIGVGVIEGPALVLGRGGWKVEEELLVAEVNIFKNGSFLGFFLIGMLLQYRLELTIRVYVGVEVGSFGN